MSMFFFFFFRFFFLSIKRYNFYDFQFAPLDVRTFQNGAYSQGTTLSNFFSSIVLIPDEKGDIELNYEILQNLVFMKVFSFTLGVHLTTKLVGNSLKNRLQKDFIILFLNLRFCLSQMLFLYVSFLNRELKLEKQRANKRLSELP